MGRKYDVIIFGATGFTGKYAVENVATLLRDKQTESFTWAVAGRSGRKLTDILREVTAATGIDLSGVDKIEADTANAESLQAMTKQCTVLLNCVGPYRFFGEAVVKACLAESTHMVDISGEPQYMEKVQIRYHKEAEEKNVYIVSACGFDSVPADCGTTLLQQKFEGDVNSVEMYLEFDSHGKGGGLHYGTWQSAIYGLAHAGELREMRQQLFTKPLPKPKYKMPTRSVLHYSQTVKGWCLPFPGSDRSIVKRSQYHFYHEDKKRPTQMNAFIKMPSLFASLITMVVATTFGVLAQFKCGRYLLEKFPRIFSFGMASHDGPTKDQMESLDFKMTLVGEGWKDKLSEPSDQHSEPPNKKMTVTVRGNNPGYGATNLMLIQSALTVLRESDKLPSKGGVYTPGVAFANTTLVDRLNKTGVVFTVESDPQ